MLRINSNTIRKYIFSLGRKVEFPRGNTRRSYALQLGAEHHQGGVVSIATPLPFPIGGIDYHYYSLSPVLSILVWYLYLDIIHRPWAISKLFVLWTASVYGGGSVPSNTTDSRETKVSHFAVIKIAWGLSRPFKPSKILHHSSHHSTIRRFYVTELISYSSFTPSFSSDWHRCFMGIFEFSLFFSLKVKVYCTFRWND